MDWRERVAREKRAAFRDHEYWGKPVPGFGDSRARLLIVGLAPAAHGANRTGRMFTGDRSGDWLYRALYKAGFANRPTALGIDDGVVLTDAYITAPVRCCPPANKPTADERNRCRGWLEAEMDLLPRIRVIVCLGSVAYSDVLRLLRDRGIAVPSPRPAFVHGVEVGTDGPRVIGSYHPSQQNTFTGKLTEDMLDAVFTRARRALG
ncbi:MAG: uracil-DNA glycosylase [Acidimicrobiia bacterium]